MQFRLVSYVHFICHSHNVHLMCMFKTLFISIHRSMMKMFCVICYHHLVREPSWS